MNATYIISLDTTEATLETVGGKGRSLAKMTTAGFPVPGGFLLATAAYKRFVEETGLQAEIIKLAKPEIVEKTVSFDSASERIRALFEKAPISDEMKAVIKHAYGALGEGEPALAVRSSANAEDLPDLSFAGQQDTYLNVQGADALVSAVRDCWASLWTARAISYRQENGIDHDKVAMAVVVQIMLPSDVSGVLFTANPATGERTEMIVNASFGLGEAVVGGQITPDTYVVDRETLKTREAMIGTKEQMIVSDGQQGTRVEDVAKDRRDTGSLPEALLAELSRMAIEMEQHFEGVPQDIEWAVAEGKLWLLQSRPITNLPPAPLKDVRWDLPEGFPAYAGVLARRKLSEHIPGPLSPLFEDIYVDRAIHEANIRFMEGFEYDLTGFRGHFVVNGYVYMTGGRPPLSSKYEAWIRSLRNPREKFEGPIPAKRINRPTPEQTVARWREQRVPDYLTLIRKWGSIDPGTASGEQLLEGIHALADADADYWFEGFLPVMLLTRQSDSTFHGFLERNAPGEGFTSGHFLTGLKSVAIETEEELWAIAKLVRAEGLHDLVVATPASRVLDALQYHPSGGPVLEAIGRYLDKYGHQIQSLDFREPTAGEDPTLVLLNLKALVQDPDYDPDARQAELAAKREEALKRADEYFTGTVDVPVRSRIPDRQSEKRDAKEEFHRLLEEAKRYYPLREEGLFYLGAGWPALRRLALELGRRLVEVGTLASPDEVFYLANAELEEAMEAQTESRGLPEYQGKAADRFQLREARKRLRNPPQIPLPDIDSGKAEGQGMGGVRITGGWVLGSVQMQNAPASRTLEGFACSPGQVTAEASVILSPGGFGKMKPGTVLVCPMTTPAWTHLFSQAAGLVTDVGGILSHGSIVAREYGIPAVLGTGNITERIVSGQRIAVDGDKGTVTILPDD